MPRGTDNLGATVEQLLATASVDFLHQLGHRLWHGRQRRVGKRGGDVALQQRVAQAKDLRTALPQLAPGQDQARGEPQHVPTPRAMRRFVEIIQLKGRVALLPRTVLLNRRAEGTEILEVRVTLNDAVTLGPRSQVRRRRQQLIEDGRRPAQIGERRSPHPRNLARQQRRKTRRTLTIELELSLGETPGLHDGHATSGEPTDATSVVPPQAAPGP